MRRILKLRCLYSGLLLGICAFCVMHVYVTFSLDGDWVITQWLSTGYGMGRKQEQGKRELESVPAGDTRAVSRHPTSYTEIFPFRPWYVTISADEFRQTAPQLTGNLLIDDYGNNNMSRPGENGREMTFTTNESHIVQTQMRQFRINTFASDRIPLNRIVPDSRPTGCEDIKYPHDLPTASIVVPFYNEWPSILLRTVYSIINRSPRHLIKEIVLVDDASDMESLKEPLDKYINSSFPRGLVKLIHLPKRVGLIQGRLIGWKQTTSDVIVFFDCHMEVNIDWLQPLLLEVKKDRRTVAMGTLDDIDAKTFQYKFHKGTVFRYGFDWKLRFFGSHFSKSQKNNKTRTDPLIGVVMVGAAYAIDSKYFQEIGTYDEGMDVWGGENLEMAWRVWLCGGRLVHLPCSHIGHITRSQPYSFPGGRAAVEVRNYKRAVDVWMGDHKKYVYDHFPDMATADAGDLSERIKLKERLKCKNFTWFIDNIFPELNVFERDALAWGSVSNVATDQCLDTHNFLFKHKADLFTKPCTHKLAAQGFKWGKDHRLRSSLHCVVENGGTVLLDDCVDRQQDLWTHKKNGQIRHEKTGKCLALGKDGPVVTHCIPHSPAQQWTFRFYNI